MHNLTVYLEQRPEFFQRALMGNLAYTLGQRRSHLAWKIAIPSSAGTDLITTLASSKLEPIRSLREPKIGFVFTGQGAQWHGMGRELMNSYPVFSFTMKAADQILAELGADFSLIGKSVLPPVVDIVC